MADLPLPCLPPASPAVELRYASGTIEIRGLPPAVVGLPATCAFDARTASHRAPACAYADVMRALHRLGINVADQARAYTTLDAGLMVVREPRPYQAEALAAWRKHGGRGVVVLPTGAGKTVLAMMAIDDRRRSTLVVAPTLDLVRQWHDELHTAFAVRIGVVGGGEYEVQPLTVTTYDSAYMHMEHLGHRFGFLVFDECHHLPGASYALAARLALAPFRLGLTATPERSDGREADLSTLIGPTVYRKDIVELSGDYLSGYETRRITVHLSAPEREVYLATRSLYTTFLSEQHISMGSPGGWAQFIMRASRTDQGRQALRAYRRQKELALSAPAKLTCLDRLLVRHRHDRTLVFTQDNATCHTIARRFLVPAITHHTKVHERSSILAGLSAGRYGVVVTSKVLNEGIDIPDANVAIVLSGSGSVREHVQRLGRILRKRDGKHALLYELITGDTGEGYTSARRREHSAYR